MEHAVAFLFSVWFDKSHVNDVQHYHHVQLHTAFVIHFMGLHRFVSQRWIGRIKFGRVLNLLLPYIHVKIVSHFLLAAEMSYFLVPH